MQTLLIIVTVILGVASLATCFVEEGEHHWWEAVAVFGFIGCITWLQLL